MLEVKFYNVRVYLEGTLCDMQTTDDHGVRDIIRSYGSKILHEQTDRERNEKTLIIRNYNIHKNMVVVINTVFQGAINL